MDKKIFIKSLFLIILFPLLLSANILASEEPGENEGDHHGIGAEQLIRGERLFFGLVYQGEKSINCAACHNTRFSDTINWNPDAFEISVKYASLSAEDLGSVLLKPRGMKLSEVHKDFDLTEEDITMIKAYMDVIAENGLVQPKPVINKLLLFIFMFVILIAMLVELAFIKRLKPRWIHLIIILGAGFYITQSLVRDAIAIGRSKDYSPDQPIKFSHAVHAGENQIDCLYCHSSAEHGKSAGIPGVNVCMNCHLVVRNGTKTGAWEISKVVEAFEKNDPVEWIRVHNNPDHVFFSHAQHVSVAGLDCRECHGDVEKMDRIIQVSDLSMGWCVNCHREKEVDFHSNEFYETYDILKEKVKKGEIDKVTINDVGGIECMKCHY